MMIDNILKFKIGQKVYHPRISKDNGFIDIREYYITNINIWINYKNEINIDYFASTSKTKLGKKFWNGDLLFETYEDTINYVEKKCKQCR